MAAAAWWLSFGRGHLGGGSRWTEKLFHRAEKVSSPRLKITFLCPREISQLRAYLLSGRGPSDPNQASSLPRFSARTELRVLRALEAYVAGHSLDSFSALPTGIAGSVGSVTW